MKSKSNKVIHLTQKSPTYWKVILDNPPLNIIGPRKCPNLLPSSRTFFLADNRISGSDFRPVPIISRFRQLLRSDLESPEIERQFGRGWLSGVAALILAISGFLLVLCLRFPSWFTVPQIRAVYEKPVFHIGLQVWLVAAFVLAIISLVLRQNKILGFTALFLVVLATTLGGAQTGAAVSGPSPVFFGMDWFVLNVIFTGLLFVPVEMLFPRNRGQKLFRFEWREDLFYYLVSSMMVQCLTYASLCRLFSWLPTPTGLRSGRPSPHSPSCCNSSKSCS